VLFRSEKWLLMQSVHVRTTTLTDYTSKVRRNIIKGLGHMRMADATEGSFIAVSERRANFSSNC